MDIQKLMDEYFNWFKKETTLSKTGEYYEITTPFLDPINDYIQIYVKQDGNQILFSDDGATIRNLEMAGLSFTPKRKQLISEIARQFNSEIIGKELTAKSSHKDFPQQKLYFIQAILRISDMYIASQNRVSSFFFEDVLDYFDKNDIFASQSVSLSGKSGYKYVYDFLFSPTKTRPERLCNVINNPTKSNVNSALFSWIDTKDTRKSNSEFILIVNDDKKIQNGVLEAANNYDVHTIKWSERENPENKLLLTA